MAAFMLGVFAMLLQAGFVVQAFQLRATNFRGETLIASLVGSFFHWTTLLVYFIVFGVGGASNVRQLTGPSSMAFWSMWTNLWPLLGLGSLFGGIVVLVTSLAPPYPNQRAGDVVSFAARWCGMVVAGCALYILSTYFPDA